MEQYIFTPGANRHAQAYFARTLCYGYIHDIHNTYDEKTIKTLLALASAVMMMSCNQTSKNDLKQADQNFKAGNNDLKEAITAVDSTAKGNASADWTAFKASSDSSILALNKKVDTIKVNIAAANKKNKLVLADELKRTRQKIDTLQAHLDRRDREFKKDINSYNASVKEKNESFKREFKHDSKELGAALKDIFKDNVK